MESKIPVPTDNIYKFYALFSLLLLVFSLGAVVYVGDRANQVVLDNVVEVETLKAQKDLTIGQQVRKAALQRKMDVATSDRQFFINLLSVLSGCAVLGMFYGFKKWHTEIQPILDETAKVQLEISRLQLAKLRSESGSNP